MNIHNLTNIEVSISKRMPKNGSFEERDTYLESHKLYGDLRSLFVEYAALAIEGDAEALKRALFFSWYQCSEPNQLSGLSELNEELIFKVLKKVDSYIETKSIDTELTFMLPYYFEVCDWYFERFTGLDNLLHASKNNIDKWAQEAPNQNWDNRGMMGEYWISKGL